MKTKKAKETLRIEDLNLKEKTCEKIRKEAKRLGVTNKTMVQIILDAVVEELEIAVNSPKKIEIEKEKR